MTDKEKIISDLETSKFILCNPYMINDSMLIKIGQAITNGIHLLKEQEEQIKKYELEKSWDEYPDTMGRW